MTNQALPKSSRDLLSNTIADCQNLGLILDKYAPWGMNDRGDWDLVMRSTIRRRREDKIQTLSGGEAKGIWLDTRREARPGESPSLFEAERTDLALMRARQRRWQNMVESGGGLAFKIDTSERLVAGLGASHVLETALTLERNTGLPYLPGSSVKGLTRARGLIDVATQLNIRLNESLDEVEPLNILAEILMKEADDTVLRKVSELAGMTSLSEDAVAYVNWFRFIFGTQVNAAAVSFLDAIYFGEGAPRYASDVMTPHYVNYYTDKGNSAPAEDDNPNPVSFITVDRGNTFAFGLVPRWGAFSPQHTRLKTAITTAADWLVKALAQMGAGSKTAAGYGYFGTKSFDMLIELRS